jgi:hypothetical protein
MEPPMNVNEELSFYLDQLEAFKVAFQALLDGAVGPDGTIKEPAALLLTLYQKITAILLLSLRSESEMVYDDFLSDFRHIVRTSVVLMLLHNSTQLPRNTNGASNSESCHRCF